MTDNICAFRSAPITPRKNQTTKKRISPKRYRAASNGVVAPLETVRSAVNTSYGPTTARHDIIRCSSSLRSVDFARIRGLGFEEKQRTSRKFCTWDANGPYADKTIADGRRFLQNEKSFSSFASLQTIRKTGEVLLDVLSKHKRFEKFLLYRNTRSEIPLSGHGNETSPDRTRTTEHPCSTDPQSPMTGGYESSRHFRPLCFRFTVGIRKPSLTNAIPAHVL